MSDVKQCDVCGDTFETKGFAQNFGRIERPFRYKVWSVLPWNREKVGWVKQDLCVGCNSQLPDAIELMKRVGESDE